MFIKPVGTWLRGIVNIVDVHARRPRAEYAPYLAAKAGLWTLTEALAVELEQALAAINAHDGGAYLEVMIPPEESQPLAETLIETMHQTATPHPEAAE